MRARERIASAVSLLERCRVAAVGQVAAFRNHRTAAVDGECEVGTVRFGELQLEKLEIGWTTAIEKPLWPFGTRSGS